MIRKKITGIILAGGKSNRMGTDKGLLKLGEKYLIEYPIDVLSNLCDQILISANSNSYDFLGYPIISDIVSDCGPIGGIYTGLCHSKTNWNLVLSCDMPFVSEMLLHYLIANSEHTEVTVPYHKNKLEPLCAVYHKKTKHVLERFIQKNDFKIINTYQELKLRKVLISPDLYFYKNFLFDNINFSKDLTQAFYKLDDNMLYKWDNLLIIAGTGRNVGKTTLACKIIEKTSGKKDVIGIKISPHQHTPNKNMKLIISNDNYLIFEEKNKSSLKDTSRMLSAGARKVYYIQAENFLVRQAFQAISHELDSKIPIVCESGELRNFITPSVFLVCHGSSEKKIKEKIQKLISKADAIIKFDENKPEFDLLNINFVNGKWGLKSKKMEF